MNGGYARNSIRFIHLGICIILSWSHICDNWNLDLRRRWFLIFINKVIHKIFTITYINNKTFVVAKRSKISCSRYHRIRRSHLVYTTYSRPVISRVKLHDLWLFLYIYVVFGAVIQNCLQHNRPTIIQLDGYAWLTYKHNLDIVVREYPTYIYTYT